MCPSVGAESERVRAEAMKKGGRLAGLRRRRQRSAVARRDEPRMRPSAVRRALVA